MYVIMITFLHDMIVLTLNNLSETKLLSLMLFAAWLVLRNRSHQVMIPLLFSGLFLWWRPKCYIFITNLKPFRFISSWLGPSTSWSSISASVEIMEKLKSFDLVVYILGKKWKKLRFISSLCL